MKLTRSVRGSLTHVSCGGANAYVWPGGGITVMADVLDMPSGSFGYVPTPALVAPIEFTMRMSDYAALGGHEWSPSIVLGKRARELPQHPVEYLHIGPGQGQP